MTEQADYISGKNMAKGVLCFCAASLLVFLLMPSAPYLGLNPADAVLKAGAGHVGFKGYQIPVNGKYTSLVMAQPFAEMPTGGGLDKKALDEMAGKGYERSYSSDPLADIGTQEELIAGGNKSARRSVSKESDAAGSWLSSSLENQNSAGWLVKGFNEYDESAPEAVKIRDGLHTRGLQDRGDLMDGEKRESSGLYGDREPGSY